MRRRVRGVVSSEEGERHLKEGVGRKSGEEGDDPIAAVSAV